MATQQCLARQDDDASIRLELVASPRTVPASITCPPLTAIKEEKREHFNHLPLFADLIRASYLANAQSVSPLPSLATTSIGFLLETSRMQSPTTDVTYSTLQPFRSPHSEDEEAYGRTSVSSIGSSPTLSPRDPRSSANRKVRPASRTCKFENCNQYVVDHGLCVRHGGGKRCTMEGCTSRAKHYGRCWRHGGSMECKIDGCVNRAKSRGYCWSHGGGTKCKADDCEKIAISNGLCWAHGGGKRCGAPGCMKQAYERTDNLCNSHFQKTKRETQRA